MCHQRGRLAPEDRLFLASDALADWILSTAQRPEEAPRLWRMLSGLYHPHAFRRLVEDRRAAREMKNDDVTLLRVHLTAAPVTRVLVCR
jgi:hypothetical protein